MAVHRKPKNVVIAYQQTQVACFHVSMLGLSAPDNLRQIESVFAVETNCLRVHESAETVVPALAI